MNPKMRMYKENINLRAEESRSVDEYEAFTKAAQHQLWAAWVSASLPNRTSQLENLKAPEPFQTKRK